MLKSPGLHNCALQQTVYCKSKSLQSSRSSGGFSYCLLVEWLVCQLEQVIKGCVWCKGIHCRPLPYSCHISKCMMARCQVDKHSFISLTSCSNYHVLYSLDKKLSGSDCTNGTVCLLVGQCTILDWINTAHQLLHFTYFCRHVFVQNPFQRSFSVACIVLVKKQYLYSATSSKTGHQGMVGVCRTGLWWQLVSL